MAIKQLRSVAAVSAASLILSFVMHPVAMAADGPNRATSSDVSAGRFVDSLLGPDAPRASSTRTRRPATKQRTVKRKSTLRAKLVENPNISDGSPPFALVDRYGGVLRYVEPVASIDLQPYLGKTVAVRRDTGDILLASQLALPRTRKAATGLQLAQHHEPIPAGVPTPAGEPYPTEEIFGDSGTIVDSYENGPIYLDGEYEDDGLHFGGGCANCGDGTCRRGGGCGYGARGVMYAHGEYLLWRMEGMNTPPLVIQFDNFDADGVAVNPRTIFGGNRVLEDERHGGRITLGVWLDDYGQWGVEGDYLRLGDLEESFSAGTMNGLAAPAGFFIGRPFFNTGAIGGDPTTIGPSQEDVDTNRLDGNVRVDIRSEFQSAGIRLRHNLCCREGCNTCCGDAVGCGSDIGCGSSVGCGSGIINLGGPLGRLCRLLKNGTRHTDVLYGVRWVRLNEGLRVTEDLQDLIAPISQLDVMDDFATNNDFYGGEIGYETNWSHQRWSLNFLSKVAIGSTRQQVDINGSTFINGILVNPPNNIGGLLAQRTVLADGTVVGNIGSYERDEFSMIPELGLTAGYNLTQRLKLTAGYTLLYWSNVVRPGDQIDIDVDATLLPRDGGLGVGAGPGSHPRFDFVQTDLWLHGLNLGAEFTW